MSAWVQHVKSYCTSHNMKYKEAMSHPDCKASYQSSKGSSPTSLVKTTRTKKSSSPKFVIPKDILKMKSSESVRMPKPTFQTNKSYSLMGKLNEEFPTFKKPANLVEKKRRKLTAMSNRATTIEEVKEGEGGGIGGREEKSGEIPTFG